MPDKPKAVRLPFAVIVSGSKWQVPQAFPPSHWRVMEAIRETPQRLYHERGKGLSWSAEPYGYVDKNRSVLARFGTREQAEDYLAKALAFVATEAFERAQAVEALQAAQARLRSADDALRERSKLFWLEAREMGQGGGS